MINVTQVKSATQAMSYYEADDYYNEGRTAPSRWIGKGAEQLGLNGEVDRRVFGNLLAGILPTGKQLGVPCGANVRHNCGLDITISANKSLSIAALVGGDHFLRDVHEQAVSETIEYLQEFATARVRLAEKTVELRSTQSFVVAAFDHVTSRAHDPNLHTHCLLMNCTYDEVSEQWRSLERREIFSLQKVADEIYKQAIASRVLEAGYHIEQTKDGWEFTEVSKECRDLFSRRRAQIDNKLASWDLNRITADAKVRERASLSTRATKKKNVNHQNLQQEWQTRAIAAGMRFEAVRTNERCVTPEEKQKAASNSVAKAIEDIGERQSRFTNIELEQRAIRLARATSASLPDIRASIQEAARGKVIEPRMVKTYKGQQYGWASIDGIQTESRLLNLENRGRESIVSLLPDNLAEETLAVLESSSDHRWTTGQRSALVGILSCKNRIQGLQGFAGTAKTTTVLKALAELASENGFVVRGIAPTHSAAQQLATGASLLSEALTVKAHLLAERYLSSDPNRAAEFWIVDEASLVSARETVMLLKAAERACARVLLVGDVQQLGSIEAGEAFRQLQESGMVTHVLEQIVRQRNNNAKNAVYQSIEGDLAGAMNSIRRSGQVAEIPDKNERVAQMALDYLNLSRSERERTIVIEPSRAGRDELNRLIRDGLREEGTLKGPQLVAESLEKVDFSSVFAKDASRYTEDDFLIFSKDLRRVGIKKGRYYQIENIDFEKKMLSLRDDNGGKVQWLPAQAGSGRVEVYRSAPFNLCVGDSIAWTRNDRLKGLKNGQLMTVIAKAGGHIKVAEPSGKEHLIDINRREGQHLRHSYCVTVHASQGLTSDRVIAQLSYKNHNLVSQRAFYVSVSRAREEIRIYTDNASALVQHLDNTSGMQQTALESGLARDGFGMHDTDAYCLG